MSAEPENLKIQTIEAKGLGIPLSLPNFNENQNVYNPMTKSYSYPTSLPVTSSYTADPILSMYPVLGQDGGVSGNGGMSQDYYNYYMYQYYYMMQQKQMENAEKVVEERKVEEKKVEEKKEKKGKKDKGGSSGGSRFSQEVVEVLKKEYDIDHRPSKDRRLSIAKQTNLKDRQIDSWFRRRRMKLGHNVLEEETLTVEFVLACKKCQDQNGGLLSPKFFQFKQLMTESKFDEQKDVILSVLTKTSVELINRFEVEYRGLAILSEWLRQGLKKNDDTLIFNILKTLKRFPISIEALKKTGVGKTLTKLTKQDINPEILKISTSLLKKWKSDVKKRKRDEVEETTSFESKLDLESSKPQKKRRIITKEQSMPETRTVTLLDSIDITLPRKAPRKVDRTSAPSSADDVKKLKREQIKTEISTVHDDVVMEEANNSPKVHWPVQRDLVFVTKYRRPKSKAASKNVKIFGTENHLAGVANHELEKWKERLKIKSNLKWKIPKRLLNISQRSEVQSEAGPIQAERISLKVIASYLSKSQIPNSPKNDKNFDEKIEGEVKIIPFDVVPDMTQIDFSAIQQLLSTLSSVVNPTGQFPGQALGMPPVMDPRRGPPLTMDTRRGPPTMDTRRGPPPVIDLRRGPPVDQYQTQFQSGNVDNHDRGYDQRGRSNSRGNNPGNRGRDRNDNPGNSRGNSRGNNPGNNRGRDRNDNPNQGPVNNRGKGSGGRGGEKQVKYPYPCKFLNSPKGCKNGDDCPFSHDIPYDPSQDTSLNQPAVRLNGREQYGRPDDMNFNPNQNFDPYQNFNPNQNRNFSPQDQYNQNRSTSYRENYNPPVNNYDQSNHQDRGRGNDQYQGNQYSNRNNYQERDPPQYNDNQNNYHRNSGRHQSSPDRSNSHRRYESRNQSNYRR